MELMETANAIRQYLATSDVAPLEKEINIMIKQFFFSPEEVVDEFHFAGQKWFGDDVAWEVEREVQSLLERG